MTPTVAIILTILIILLSFRLDIKRKSNVSSALWISLIWMAYSASRPFSFWLSGSPDSLSAESYIEGNPIDRNILSALTILGILVLFRRRNKVWKLFRSNTFVLLWFLYCGISILWSGYPMVSFKRYVKEIGLLSGILIVATEDEPIDAVIVLMKRFSYLLVSLSVMLILFIPELGIDRVTSSGAIRYAGVAYNKNSLARICLIAGFFLFCNMIAMKRTNATPNYKENNLIQLLFLTITVGLLIIVNSATSTGAFLIGVIVFIGLGRRIFRDNMEYLGTIFIISLIAGIIIEYSFDIISVFVTTQGRDMTLSGRTSLWKDLLAFHTNPLIGVGYRSFWLGDRMTKLWELYPFMPNESHNGYLNVYLELGSVGLVLLLGIIYCAYRNIKHQLLTNFNFGRFRMGMFIIALLYNITEDAIGKMTLLWFIFLLISLEIPVQSPLQRNHGERKKGAYVSP